MQTLSQLVAHTTSVCWPFGEAENLVTQHKQLIIEGIIDIQKWVECYQRNNVDILRNCSVYFQCGMTVFAAPRGDIHRISTFDRINASTGKEDKDADVNWCSEIIYSYVEYGVLRKIVDNILCARASCSPIVLPGQCGWPVPTNAQYPGYPELPLGFNYPQESLNRTGDCILSCSPRAKVGVWAFNNGRIYLAPWVQSTEDVAIQWNGIKRDFTNLDLVPSSADYEEAIKYWTLWGHFRDYERDLEMAAMYKGEYERVRSFLIRDCRNETRDHSKEPSLARQTIKTLMGQSTGTLPCGPEYEDVIPVITSAAPSYFQSGDDLPAGDYTVEYVSGCLKYSAGGLYFVNHDAVNTFRVIYSDGASSVVAAPTTYVGYATQVEVEGHYAGQTVQFTHTGGKIAVSLADADYSDNAPGELTNPRFRLRNVCP